MDQTRREFIRSSGLGATALYLGAAAFPAISRARVPGANDTVRVGIAGFSDRFRSSLLPAFVEHMKEMNFDIVALSDLWSMRREEGKAHLEKTLGHPIDVYPNNEAMYEKANLDAVIISTADFQHAMHTAEAVGAGLDTYTEKPLAETMDDARAVFDAVKKSGRIVQIGSQRRSGKTYHAANDFIRSGDFGPIVMVELTWNVNQPGRWRRPAAVAKLKEEDTDWKRFLLNRPKTAFDPRKYLEFRLFWPFSSGIPGQWMCHQIDTVHWFANLPHPRSVVANGGNYVWKDGRENADTFTAVFDYGPLDKPGEGFQVLFTSRQTNSEGGTKEIYYSNGGTLDLSTNKISPKGGLGEKEAAEMKMKPFLLAEKSLSEMAAAGPATTAANTGKDELTTSHMRNWMECVRSRKEPNAPIDAGFNHSVACIMSNAALRTGQRVTFDAKKREVIAGGKAFKYG